MKILIATDGSEFSRAAIEKCCQLIMQPENTEIRILSVFENVAPAAAEPFAVSADYVWQYEAAARHQAEDFALQAERQIRAASAPDASLVIIKEVEKGEAEQVIVETAKNWGADLIVVGSHGRGFWSRMLMGSVSNAVVNYAPCSVLVVRSAPHKNG